MIIVLCLFFNSTQARSIYREGDPRGAYINITYTGDPLCYQWKDQYLRPQPLFQSFHHDHFFQHLLPKSPITYRYNPRQSIEGRILSNLAETAIAEIQAGKKKFTHFTILKKSNFHFKTKSGLLILKFNDFPFILKLFIENPRGLKNPYKKGAIPTIYFIMGGSTRHLIGFTRISTLEKIQQKIKNSIWAELIDVPRKWFWMPDQGPWLTLTAYQMFNQPRTVSFPAIYGIIADEIQEERPLSL